MRITNIPPNIFLIGLMGSIGAGKSSVATLFHKLGAEVINADAFTYKVLKTPQVQQEIVRLWGHHLLVGGEIDKQSLAKIVFPKEGTDRTNLERLENILHPLVYREIRETLNNIAHKGKRIIVLDVPLLWEIGLFQDCHALIFVDAPWEIRKERVIQSRHWSSEELMVREKFQGDPKTKRQIAHYTIHNEGNLEETYQQVQAIWSSLLPKNL